MRKRFLVGSFLACLVHSGATLAWAGWTTLPNAPTAPALFGRHDDLFFAGPDSGWVVNGGGEIFRTIDGGESWTLQVTLPTYLRSVGFANPLKGWAGSLLSAPLLYATNDGGVVWTPVLNIPPPQPNGICGIWVVNASVVYGCGRYDGPPARMIKTTDGGTTWTSWDMAAYASSLIDCFFLDESRGFVVGGIGPSLQDRHAVILATTDGGATWETRHVTGREGGEWCWKISFPTPSVGYVSVERQGEGQAYVLKTTDGGETWAEVFFLDAFDEEGIGFATPNRGWVGGWTGPTYETTDGGASWDLADFGEVVNRFRFVSPALGYAVGYTVYRYTADETDVAGERVETPALALFQNRPNPVLGSTRIPFTLDAEANVRVTIHDAQGRRMLTLLEGRRSAGRHELTWDGRDGAGNRVGAGVYWYRVESAHGARARKLLVIR
jgi:photosystem II stability/assembly factor-like uncharacterized protein